MQCNLLMGHYFCIIDLMPGSVNSTLFVDFLQNDCNFINLGCLWMCVCMCVNAWVPLCIVSICPAGRLAERLKLIVLSPPLWCLQGGKEPVSLPTVQTTAGRVSICWAGAHPRAHPGLRQEGRAALQMPSWRFCQFEPSWKEGCREDGRKQEIGRDECIYIVGTCFQDAYSNIKYWVNTDIEENIMNFPNTKI